MKALIPLIVPLFLYGCFGSDDNASTSLSGTVADGYIENATVCFDSNGNLSCDDSEPTTTTAADGSYSITANGSVAGLAVIAVVGPDSKDADDGGLTMSEAGKEGFNFMAPAENPEVVSPLSTLVQFEIISNPDFSLDEAQGAVKETLGIDNDDLNLLEYDFVAAAETGDSFATNIKNVTEVLSSALGDVTKNMSDDNAIANLKAGGDDGMKAFQTGIMDMIKETVIPQTVAGGAVTGTVDDLKAQLKGAFRPGDCSGGSDCNTTGSLVSGFQTAVTAKKKAVKVAATAGKQTISDVKAIMENGVVIGYPVDDENYLNSSGVETAIGADSTGLFIEYHKMATNGEYFAEKILIEGKWYDVAPSLIGSMEFESEWTMDPKTGIWSPGDMPFDDGGSGDYSGGDPSDHMPTFSKGCMSFPGSYSEKLCFKERDLSGKTIASVMCPDGTSTSGEDEFCDALDGSSAKFKSGSKGLDVSISNNFDLYQVEVDPCVFDSSATAAAHPATSNCDIGFTDGSSNPIKDLDTFKSTYSLSETTMGYIGNDCNVVFTFDDKNILYADGGSCSSVKTISAADGEGVESLPFETITVGTSKVIVSGVPQIFRENNPGDLPVGSKILFAAFATNGSLIMDASTNPSGMGVFSGYFMLSGVSQKYSFDTGEEKIGTYQFLDSIIEAQSWDAFPYPTSTYEQPQSYMPGQGGSEAECTAWITDASESRQPLPGFGCFDYCMEAESDDATCFGASNSICSNIASLISDGDLESSESDIWGCPE